VRICQVDEEGRFGGPEQRITIVAHELSKFSDIDLCLIIPKIDSQYFSSLLAKLDVDYSRLDITRLSLQLGVLTRYVFRFGYELFTVAYFLRRRNIDLVHVNGAYQFRTALSAIIANKRFIWHLNDTNVPWPIRFIFHVFSYFSSGFISTGVKAYDYYVRFSYQSRKPYVMIQPPVADNFFYYPTTTKPQSEKHKRRLLIGTVAGINPAKGLEFFIRMASLAINSGIEADFIIAGQELKSQRRYAAKIKNLVSDLGLSNYIHFHGFITNVPEFLEHLDIVVISSVTEAGPLALWESMAAMKPVITTDVGSVSEYVVSGTHALVVPCKDSESLFAALQKLVRDHSLQVALAKSAYLLAKEKFSAKSIGLRYYEFYSKIMS